jgi:hypothetical protein
MLVAVAFGEKHKETNTLLMVSISLKRHFDGARDASQRL